MSLCTATCTVKAALGSASHAAPLAYLASGHAQSFLFIFSFKHKAMLHCQHQLLSTTLHQHWQCQRIPGSTTPGVKTNGNAQPISSSVQAVYCVHQHLHPLVILQPHDEGQNCSKLLQLPCIRHNKRNIGLAQPQCNSVVSHPVLQQPCHHTASATTLWHTTLPVTGILKSRSTRSRASS